MGFCSIFQSTLPARGATQEYAASVTETEFQSTLPARGATFQIKPPVDGEQYFNPRSPHGERLVQSSLWSADRHFNPRSPHGERRLQFQPAGKPMRFQSTLPARGATAVFPAPASPSRFQSTLPARGATANASSRWSLRMISIHAPRTGSDCGRHFSVAAAPHFNPRSPHGERRASAKNAPVFVQFQSTLPARGATSQGQTHTRRLVFQSTLPARGATPPVVWLQRNHDISIHAPRTGSDPRLRRPCLDAAGHFNPRSPHGERRHDHHLPLYGRGNFNPRSPHGERHPCRTA